MHRIRLGSLPLLALLCALQVARADGKCELADWELTLRAGGSTFPTEAEAARWGDAHLLGGEDGFAIDVGGDGTVELRTTFADTAHRSAGPHAPPIAVLAGCADYRCGSELGGGFVVTEADRPELVGAFLGVDSEEAVLTFTSDDGDVRVVWDLGDWLPHAGDR